MKTLQLSIISFLSMMLLFSCSKDESFTENLQEINSNTQRTLTNERLSFSSFDELRSFISQRLESEDIDFLDEAYRMAEEEGYSSLLYLYDLNNEELEEKGINGQQLASVYSYDDLLLFLLNKDGEIEIENKIYRINKEFVYIYEPNNSNLIEEFLIEFNNGLLQMEREETLEYDENLTVYMHSNDPIVDEESSRSQSANLHFNNNLRMQAKQYKNSWFFYASIGVSTKVQQRKKTFFGLFKKWKSKRANNLVSYDLGWMQAYPDPNNSIPIPVFISQEYGSKSCFCNSANKRFDWFAGIGIPKYYFLEDGRSGHAAAVTGISSTPLFTTLETN